MLVDIVSKNGNLMLSVPVRSDGTIDEDEQRIVASIGSWLKVNGEAIYGTRPWKIYGEGPSTIEAGETNRFGGVKDVGSKPYSAADIRFTTKGAKLYAIILAWPTDGQVNIQSLAESSPACPGGISGVKLLGSDEKINWMRDKSALHITLPKQKPCDIAYALEITTVIL